MAAARSWRHRVQSAGHHGLLIIGGTLLYHWVGTTEYQNEFTGRTQKLAIATPEEEIALGLQSAPEMIRESGGLSRDAAGRALVEQVGSRLIASTAAKQTPYQFKFHLLADERTVNAFALAWRADFHHRGPVSTPQIGRPARRSARA
jgi:predicted Zn-dependent protease